MIALIVGLVVMGLGVMGILRWPGAFKTVLEGALPAMLVCGGILAVIAGATSIRDAMEARKLEQGNKEG